MQSHNPDLPDGTNSPCLGDMTEVRTVIVCMFEPNGGQPGEISYYRERLGLKRVNAKASGLDEVYSNTDGTVLALTAGVGTANTAISVTALGMCGQFDLRRAYWLISGIAGVNPHNCSLGSVVWADWCVDGDLAFEIDSRDTPGEWPIGIIPLGAREPFGASTLNSGYFGRPYQVFALNSRLVDMAHAATRHLQLTDSEAMAGARAQYKGFAQALKPPSVMRGDVLAATRFWHGPRHNAWAEQWVRHWTGEKGRFVACSMEDTGTLLALTHLDRLKLADYQRVMLLRSASNHTTPPPGMGVMDSLMGDAPDGEANLPGYIPALENAYLAGSTMIDTIQKNWPDL